MISHILTGLNKKKKNKCYFDIAERELKSKTQTDVIASKPHIFFFLLIRSRRFGVLHIYVFLMYTISLNTLTKLYLKMQNIPTYNSNQRLLASYKNICWLSLPSITCAETRLTGKHPRSENGMIPVQKAELEL